MIYNIKREEKKYWVLFKEAIETECRNQVYMVLSDKSYLQNPMINENFVVYAGVELLNHPFLQEDGTLREATDKELIDKGIYILEEDEVLDGDVVKTIYEFPIPEGTVKPVFNKETLTWEETASIEEIVTHEEKEKEIFYNSELGLATKAHTEYDMGMISDTDYNEVKDYINAINPYKMKSVRAFSFLALPTVKRPVLFERYENKL